MATDAPTLDQIDTAEREGTSIESVADSLRAVMDGTGDEATPPSGEKPATKDTPADSDRRAGDQPRDDRGRWTKEQQEAADREAAAKAAEKPESKEGKKPAAADDDDEDKPLAPPAAWKAEEHALFHAMQPAQQKLILDKLADAEKRAGETDGLRQRYTAIDQIIGSRRDAWARDGMDEATAIKQLIALSDYAARTPEEFVRWFVQGRNLDPAKVFGLSAAAKDSAGDADDGGYDEEYATPLEKKLMAQVSELTEKLGKISGTFETQAEREKAAQREAIAREVNDFRTARDDKGNLKHPYYDQLDSRMASLILSEKEQGRLLTLAQAYDMACRIDPDVSAKLDAARKAEAERAQARSEREKAAAARKAGSSVTGKPGPSEKPATGDLRDDLRAEFTSRGWLQNAI